MRTLTEQYRSVKEGKGPKDVFLKEAKRQFPNLLKNNSTFKETTTILKQKGIISENFAGIPMVGNPLERKKESYETAFANFLAEAEAKAEEKKVSKKVKEDAEKNYNYKDEKDPNNMIFGQIQMGYYYEMKQEKNADKTIDEIKDIVFKNLAKDPIHYTKTGQFGEDIGYTDVQFERKKTPLTPSSGPTDEIKGKYKSSGHSELKENKEPVNEIAIAGGIVAGGGFTSQNYMDFYGLNEDEKELKDTSDAAKELKSDFEELAAAREKAGLEVEEGVKMASEKKAEALLRAAEEYLKEVDTIDDVIYFIEANLETQESDIWNKYL